MDEDTYNQTSDEEMIENITSFTPEDFNTFNTNYDKNKKDYNKLLNDNTLLINDVSTKLNNINFKKQIFDYLQKKYKNESYVVNIMTEDIIQIFKNNVNSLKLKYN